MSVDRNKYIIIASFMPDIPEEPLLVCFFGSRGSGSTPPAELDTQCKDHLPRFFLIWGLALQVTHFNTLELCSITYMYAVVHFFHSPGKSELECCAIHKELSCISQYVVSSS